MMGQYFFSMFPTEPASPTLSRSAGEKAVSEKGLRTIARLGRKRVLVTTLANPRRLSFNPVQRFGSHWFA
jgi:hypothetical protein